MKCAAIKLSSRVDRTGCRGINKENSSSSTFKGDEGHSYSFPFFPRKQGPPPSTTLAVTTIDPPENLEGFNTGSSLKRWSQKRSRWRSAKVSKTPTEFDTGFCYETLESDLSLLLNDEERPGSPDVGSLGNLHYEVHTDVERLLQESQRTVDAEDEAEDGKRRRSKKEKKKSKTVKISKPSTPQTEQVIRVDVTSNVSSEETKKVEENCPKTEEKTNEKGVDVCNEEFIVKCRQLALKQRRKQFR